MKRFQILYLLSFLSLFFMFFFCLFLSFTLNNNCPLFSGASQRYLAVNSAVSLLYIMYPNMWIVFFKAYPNQVCRLFSRSMLNCVNALEPRPPERAALVPAEEKPHDSCMCSISYYSLFFWFVSVPFSFLLCLDYKTLQQVQI